MIKVYNRPKTKYNELVISSAIIYENQSTKEECTKRFYSLYDICQEEKRLLKQGYILRPEYEFYPFEFIKRI